MTWPLGFRAVRPVRFAFNVVFRALAGLVLLLTAGTLAQGQTAHFSGATSTVGSGFSFPSQIAVDASGDVFVADSGNHAVKEIVAVYGVVSSTSQVMTVGSGFSGPCGVALDSKGDVFVGDYAGNAVKEVVAVGGVVSPNSAVNTVGSGFSNPCGVAVDSKGDVFVADSNNAKVKEIVAVNGLVSPGSVVNTVGSGFSQPLGVAVDASGDVFVGDNNTEKVQEIVAVAGVVSSTSQVKTLSSGQFGQPVAVAVDASGDVFVADNYYNTVTEIIAVGGVVSSTSQVKTLGSGFSSPSGVSVGASGDVFIADSSHNAVKEIQLQSVNFGGVAVASSAAQTLTFTFDTGGQIALPKVVTQGATGLDFTDMGDGTCTSNGTSHTYNAGQSCTVDVKFAPTVPGQRLGAVEMVNTSGTVIAAGLVYGTGTGPLVSFPGNTAISTLGGGFSVPTGVAVDASGDVFLTDYFATSIEEVPLGCATSSCVTSLGGGLNGPSGIAVDGAGNVYVADTFNNAVKEMPAGCASSSCVTSLGGGFSDPRGVAVDPAGNVYVADDVALSWMPPGCTSSTCVKTLGGGFGRLFDVALDGSGNAYVAEPDDSLVKKLSLTCTSSSCVTTLAGTFLSPFALAVDASGNVYVATQGADTVKQIPSGCAGASCAVTLGSGFANPSGIAVGGNGNVYVADTENAVLKELAFATPPTVTFATSTADGTYDTTDGVLKVTLANIGNETLTFPTPLSGTNPSTPSDFQLDTGYPPCPNLSPGVPAGTLAAGATCLEGIVFAPVSPQNGALSESVVITDNNLNASSATQSITVKGTAIGGDTTTTNVIVSPNFVGLGGSVSVTAVISDTSNGSHTPTGSVTFTDTVGSVTTNLNSGAAVPLSGNSAHLNVTLSADGVHTITANYSGVAGTYLSSGGTAMVTVGAATHFSVTAPASAYAGQTFTSTVTALDENNQVATLYAGAVAITSSDSAAVLPANATLTNGVGTFTVTLNTPGGQSVVATDTVTSSIMGGATVSVSPPPTYTVTVATDTTSGVASNCVANVRNSTNCSLRDAIAAVTALNLPTVTPTIQFSPLLTSDGPVTITEGSAGTLTIGTNMNIVGPGQTLLAIDGANLYQVFAVNTGVTASISGVTIQHGNFTSTVSPEGAGGIYNQGALAVTNSSIVNSAATVSAGAIVTSGPLTLTASTIANNTSGAGAALQVLGTTLNMSGSAVTGNTSAGSGDPTSGGGILVGSASTALISNSTISGNSSTQAGFGGGIDVYFGSATLTNVTLSGNSSALFGGGISNFEGNLTLVQTTVTGNSARNGGGIFDDRQLSSVLKNSVVAGNSASSANPNLYTYPNSAAPVNDGGNVFDATATSTLNPELATLAKYGGSLQTQPGLPGSPVLCAGLLSNVGALTTDQRGNPRVATYGSNQCVDSGAVQTAYALSFSQQPSNTETTVAISPAPTVVLSDDGVAIQLAGAPISMTLANGTLNGTATETTDATGKATFAGLSVATAEAGETLTASAAVGANTVTATSSTFNIVSADHLTITVPATAVAGTPFTATVTAYLDRAGTQVATSYTGPVTLTSSDLAAVVPGPTMLTAGVATVQVTLKTAGSQTMKAADASGTPSGTSPAVLVTAAGINSLVAFSGGGQTVAENTGFANPLVVEAEDAYGNPVGGQTVTFTAPATGVSASFTGSPATTASGTGLAQVTATANGVPGNYSVTASVGAFSVNFALTNTGPATYTVTVATDTTSGVASNCTVNATTDTNCSLRDAIAAATALNVASITPNIQFAPALTSGGAATITEGSAGTLTLGANMNIVGPGQTLLAIDGANLYPLLVVNSGVTAAISGVTMQHGHSTGVSQGSSGINTSGTLTITDSTITQNYDASSGSAIIDSGVALTLTRCTVSNNTTGGGGGPIVLLAGTFTMSESAVTGNTSAANGFNSGGGGILVGKTVTATISNSTISGNILNGAGTGGGLEVYEGSATLTNVSVSGNSAAQFGGGIFNYGGTLTLIQTTVTGNSAPNGGGIYDEKQLATVLTNSVVAGNSASSTGTNIATYTHSAAPVDNGGNYFDTTPTSTLMPNFAVLGNYGGPTQTQPGLPGSPILCAGMASNVGSLTTDQRGNPRVATYGSNQCVDSGAVQTAYSLSFATQPSNTETGLTLVPAPAVLLEDNGVANGIPGATISIALANGTLNGTTTATTVATTGIASFAGLSIPTVETGDTLTASAAAGTNTISATSNAFNVITVTATQVVASEVLTKGQPSTTFMPVTGSGGTAPLSYSISPALPAGLTLSSTTGAITGSPTVTLSATTFTITVTDALNVTGTATFSLTVNAAVAATQAIASTQLTQNHAPAAFRPVTGSGGTGTLSYSISPSLPAGLSFSGSTGAITGTPTATSAVTVYTVTVTDNNNATASATFNLTVNTAVTATQAVASTTVVLNQAATAFTPVTGAGGTGSLGYSVSPALPTGLSLSSTTGAISGTPTVTSSATTYTVTVTDTNGATATATFSLTVILSVPPTVSSVSAVTTTYGATTGVTVTATESGNEGLATGGIVTFGLSGGATGSFSPATCTLSSAGTCTTTFTPTGTLAAGTYTGGITANFALVNSYSAASGSSTLTVNQAAQTITFAPASPVTYGVAPITLAATGGGSGNAIAYTLGSASPASLTGNLLTITGAGTVTVTANQAGNANYTAASPVTATIVVNKATPTVGLTSSVNPVLVQNTITLVATVGGVSLPSGTVSFYDNTAGAAIGSAPLISGVASLPTAALAVGTHSITAIYSGDANFVSLTSSPVSEQVDDFNLNISASSSVTTQTVVPGGTATYLLTISPTGTSTFPAAVTLSVSGLPTGATYTITPTTIAAGAGSTSVTLTITPPNAAAKLEGSRWKELAPVTLALLLLPFARRWRRSALRLRRIAYVALLVVAAAGAMAGLSGCGTGNGVFGQAPQTYNVVVTGTSGALTHSTTVTLTVE